MFIHENAFEGVVCEIASILSRPQRVKPPSVCFSYRLAKQVAVTHLWGGWNREAVTAVFSFEHITGYRCKTGAIDHRMWLEYLCNHRTHLILTASKCSLVIHLTHGQIFYPSLMDYGFLYRRSIIMDSCIEGVANIDVLPMEMPC